MEHNQQEQRKSHRIAVQFDVTVLHEGDYLISFTRDISADGMFINTTTPLSKGEMITVDFAIGLSREIKVTAEVVWVSAEGPEIDRGMGVKFIKVPTKVKKAILLLVNRIAILPDETLIH